MAENPDAGQAESGEPPRNTTPDTLLQLLRNLSYLFAGIALLNLFVQTIAFVIDYPPSIQLLNVIAGHLPAVISSFFFMAFVRFVEIVREARSDGS
jgi:hypothetical protein